VPFLGRDFFPSVDAGAIRLHVRAHTEPASRRRRCWWTKSRTRFAGGYRRGSSRA
jgi:hypothetical protein